MELAIMPISCGLATDSSSQGMGNQTRGRIAIFFGASSASKLRYPDPRQRPLLRLRRERPCRSAAERGQQSPPSDGDCHTPLPREVR